ncbi:MAG TPA: transglycosylase SLT domain-containing protein [Kofleriaceae bacterium]|nr:transglycosylase SLT domain-containing protein [Kofleriaceae bacterium]
MRRLVPFVLLVCACSGDDTHRHVATTPPAVAKGSAAPPAQAGALDEAMVASYWKTGDELDAANQFALEKWKPAHDAFALARQAAKDPDQQARLDLMLGLCEEHLEDHANAAAHLAAAYRGLPQLADYIGYHAAREMWLAHMTAEATELAGKVARDSIVGPDAEILGIDLLRGQSKWAEAETALRDYLSRHARGPFLSEVRFEIAEALEQQKKPGDEAAKLYKQIEVEDPLSSWAAKAHDRMVALKADESLSTAEHITKGMVLFDSMRNPEGEAEFAAALADPKITPEQKCIAAYHKAKSRSKARDRKNSAPMFDEAQAACEAAKNTDLAIKAAYNAGQSYSFIGQHDIAIARYKATQTIDPKHSYADDGMLREAEEWTDLNNGAKVEEVLSAIPTKYPDGDQKTEAMWRLGWRAWREQRYDDAITWWKKQIELAKPGASYNGVFGDDERAEAGYWLGRAYMAKKLTDQAVAQWADTARTYPSEYYALQSLNRLRENAPKMYEQVVAEIGKDPAGYDPNAPVFSFKARPEYQTPGFARALELLRLGLGEPAQQELKKLGLNGGNDKKQATDPDELDKLWAIAWLYDKAGRFSSSVWITRWHVLDYRQGWPVGGNRARWKIAYPLGYQEILARHAKLNNVPFAMQIGIVREESGFDPLDESYANAVGLTQMIPPTAKDFSKGTGIDPTRENLRDPEKNVTIGSRFLGSLFKDWHGYVLLVPTSYNAGPAAVRRMLRVRGTWDADEFVEGIVDDQARNYTKRVLGAFFTYSWLYEQKVPEVPIQIPPDLLPKAK